MRKLFTAGAANPKIAKSDKQGEYLTLILHLRPSKKTCPWSTKGCLAACLNTAGRGACHNVQDSRQWKTDLFYNDNKTFRAMIEKEIVAHIRKCDKLGKLPAVRMNGTSDIDWDIEWPGFFVKYSQVQFYDYTKSVARAIMSRPKNYHITFSRSEKNADKLLGIAAAGTNIAVVFDEVPKRWAGMPVFSGEDNDLRFLDPAKHIIGLRAKGKARKDRSGFVVKG
jgi:hypothetical protein